MRTQQAMRPGHPKDDAMSAMTESAAYYRASGEVEFIANCVVYNFCRALSIEADGPADKWNRDRWHEQMAPFAPVLAAMITATVQQYNLHRDLDGGVV
jgi:hypothetical protein